MNKFKIMATRHELDATIFRQTLKKADKSTKQQLLKQLEAAMNPLGNTHQLADDPEVQLLFNIRKNGKGYVILGGSGTVSGKGQSAMLGGAVAGTNITVQVQPTMGGVCTITIQAFAPGAGVPYGCWDVGGPGTATIFLGGTGGVVIPVGTPTTIVAVGKDGSFPANVVYN